MQVPMSEDPRRVEEALRIAVGQDLAGPYDLNYTDDELATLELPEGSDGADWEQWLGECAELEAELAYVRQLEGERAEAVTGPWYPSEYDRLYGDPYEGPLSRFN
jgi:hypothetical protein